MNDGDWRAAKKELRHAVRTWNDTDAAENLAAVNAGEKEQQGRSSRADKQGKGKSKTKKAKR